MVYYVSRRFSMLIKSKWQFTIYLSYIMSIYQVHYTCLSDVLYIIKLLVPRIYYIMIATAWSSLWCRTPTTDTTMLHVNYSSLTDKHWETLCRIFDRTYYHIAVWNFMFVAYVAKHMALHTHLMGFSILMLLTSPLNFGFKVRSSPRLTLRMGVYWI